MSGHWPDKVSARSSTYAARGCGSYWLEKRVSCAAHGIKLVDFTIYSRGAPTPRDVHGAAELFRAPSNIQS